jgi:hypothetical protein
MNPDKEINMDTNIELARMDYFLGILQRARREGLLCLEEIIQEIEKQENFDAFDLTYLGFRMIVDNWDYRDIEKIFVVYFKQGIDTLTFNIITESCLAIQRGDGCVRLILYYAVLLPKDIRNSNRFLSLAERYGYNFKYETWTIHEARQKNEGGSLEK